jgi:hypothetical protein
MKKYIRSLDLVAAALESMRNGRQDDAATFFLKAAKDPSVGEAVRIINLSNQMAVDRLATASKKKSAISASLAKRLAKADMGTDCEDAPLAGDELRVELDSQESMPEVQEGAAEDDPEDEDEDKDETSKARFARVLSNLTR